MCGDGIAHIPSVLGALLTRTSFAQFISGHANLSLWHGIFLLACLHPRVRGSAVETFNLPICIALVTSQKSPHCLNRLSSVYKGTGHHPSVQHSDSHPPGHHAFCFLPSGISRSSTNHLPGISPNPVPDATVVARFPVKRSRRGRTSFLRRILCRSLATYSFSLHEACPANCFFYLTPHGMPATGRLETIPWL